MSNTDTMSVYFKVKGAKEAEKDLKQLGKRGSLALNDITASAKPVNSALFALNSTIGKVSKSMTTFSGLAGAYFSFQGLKASVGQIIGTNTELQKLSASMEVAEGSIDGANTVMEKLSSLATQTPYSINALTEAWIKLKNLGLEPSEHALLSYGNTASAMGKDIMQFIEAIADASTFEFERLKEFGIKASQQNNEVAFTFQGNTTRIKKNAKDIEQYLRGLGQIQFAESMQKQMDTIGGASSNLNDNFIRIQKTIGDNEFNDSVKNLYNSMSDVVSVNQESAKSIGLALASITNGVTKVVENIDILKDATVAFVGFKALQIGTATSTTAFVTMSAAVRTTTASLALSSAMIGRTATVGIASMTALSAAARALSASVAMLGGPLGVIAIAGFAVYEFSKKGDAAAVASQKYAKELKEVEKNSKSLTSATKDLNKVTEKGQRLSILADIDEAQQAIADVQDQIKNGEYSDEGWWSSLFTNDSAEAGIMELKNQLHDGEISIDQFHSKLITMGEEDIKFRKPAQLLDNRINALRAAELALENSQERLSLFDNPELKPKETTDLKIKPVLDSETVESLLAKANSSVYQLESTMNMQIDPNSWVYGALNGLDELGSETTNYAKIAEDSLKNAFKAGEDALVGFVMTGKLQFKDLVNSILEDLLRMQIRQSITQPLAQGLSGALKGFSFGGSETVSAGVDHTGGIAGIGIKRTVPAEVFTNAPRYHTGSVIHQDEKPVIMQKGEGIVSRQQMNELLRGNGKSSNNVSVNIIHTSSGENIKAESKTSQDSNGFNIDILVEEIEGKVANNVAKNRGSLNSVLNNKYQPNGVMR